MTLLIFGKSIMYLENKVRQWYTSLVRMTTRQHTSSRAQTSIYLSSYWLARAHQAPVVMCGMRRGLANPSSTDGWVETCLIRTAFAVLLKS